MKENKLNLFFWSVRFFRQDFDLFKFVESILCSTTMDGGQLRKQALQKLPRAWCRWWYGAVEGGDDDDGAGAVAEYCVEGDGHISAFLLNNLPLDASAVHKEINAVLAGAGMTFSQTMVFAALPESLAKAVRRAPGYSYPSTKKKQKHAGCIFYPSHNCTLLLIYHGGRKVRKVVKVCSGIDRIPANHGPVKKYNK